jgi:transposase
MTRFVASDRSQPFLLPPDLRDWVPENDLAHFIVEAVERVDMSTFKVNARGSGSEQYNPRMMLALLIYCYANGIFGSRRIERATYRDVGVRFVTANTHPDHDTICAFRRENGAAFAACFLKVLELARELKLLKVGTVSVDGTKIDANASTYRSVRYDRACALREQLQGEIAELMKKAESADASGETDPQALPAEIARREALKAHLDAACARLEAEAKARAQAERADYERRKAAHETDGRNGGGKPPSPPSATPAPERQSNLTDPDSRLMRKNKRSAYRQSYNAQAAVDADGSQLVLAARVSQSASDANELVATVDAIPAPLGTASCVLGDTGYANGGEVATLEARGMGGAGGDAGTGQASATRLPSGACPGEARGGAEGAVAQGDEGQARRGCGTRQIQVAQADGGAGVRHHQERARLPPVPAAQPGQGGAGVAARDARLQRQASAQPDGGGQGCLNRGQSAPLNRPQRLGKDKTGNGTAPRRNERGAPGEPGALPYRKRRYHPLNSLPTRSPTRC